MPMSANEQRLMAVIQGMQAKMDGLERFQSEVQSILQRQENGPKWVEDLPGRRVPFFPATDLVIPASSTARVEASEPLGTDGYFVCTGVALFYRRTTAPYDGWWGPGSTVESRIAAASQGQGLAGIFDQPHAASFNVELSDQGSSRNMFSSPFSSGIFSIRTGCALVFPCALVMEPASSLGVALTPTAQLSVAGVAQALWLGYKIVEGKSYRA